MSDFISLSFGIAMFIGICWLLVQAGLLEKPHVDRAEDGAKSDRDVAKIVEATQPAPLEIPHVRAGTAYGQEVGK